MAEEAAADGSDHASAPHETRRDQAARPEARLRPIGLIQVLLLVSAAAAMATARYLP